MTDELSQLRTIRQNLLNRLEHESAELKPSYSLDGQAFAWSEFYRQIWQQIDELDRRIALGQGPFEERVRGVT